MRAFLFCSGNQCLFASGNQCQVISVIFAPLLLLSWVFSFVMAGLILWSVDVYGPFSIWVDIYLCVLEFRIRPN